MKIYVGRIPEEGLREHATYNPSTLDLERDDIHLREAFKVDVFATLADTELVVRAAIHRPLYLTCARCLDEFVLAQNTEAVFTYKVAPTDIVDITEDVRQEIILGYPMIPVCNPECKGLCIQCGHNLNRSICEHQSQEVS